ncbi:hypothetical protein HanIR_Chr14g0700121 [Helianthus annuus]|nr:hypothetical protein HanIR_Chr14g0700121 [Helianthus annuus]
MDSRLNTMSIKLKTQSMTTNKRHNGQQIKHNQIKNTMESRPKTQSMTTDKRHNG